MTLLLLLASLAAIAAPPVGPDVLVVCPREFRPAIAEWKEFRRAQGHHLVVADVPANAEQLKGTIHQANRSGTLKYIVLIGDEPSSFDSTSQTARFLIPTNYVRATVNIRWGSTAAIASDIPYADLDGDGLPDVAIGRIPAHSPQELSGVMRKIIRYESSSDHGPWEKCLDIISGAGGFGALTDAMVESAGRQVVQETVPTGYDVRHTVATVNTESESPVDCCALARRQLNEGDLAWVYVGHGLPTQLDRVPTLEGMRPLLSTRDVPQLHCGPHNPLAVLIACYTGAMDAPQDCLAEDLLLAGEGPIAVVAATRVTMPYGNSVMGYELLRACFDDRPLALGDIMLIAEKRVLGSGVNNHMRATLDNLAQLFSPGPVDLSNERREHVLMYHLIGDPLLRLHRRADEVAQNQKKTVREK
ncbi:MAG TPA: C25 family cysteine peptidase [Lacipirellulaceae bacterium]|nr:C25 family cysteine peptidase [Lacipirellulaceae bacterium]